MKIPFATAGRTSRSLCLLPLLALAGPNAMAARDPAPSVRIPLNPIGYQTMLPEFLASGSVMVTVHYADNAHLLVTFSLRRLMKRDANDPPEDADRIVGAFLLEVPSGKVVAQTEWRLHDHGQYLWDLGDGRFLLRVRDQLSVIDPGHAKPGDALREVPLLHLDRRIVSLTVSAEHDLLTLQTVERSPVVILADAPAAAAARSPVVISFFRLQPAGDKLTVAVAGSVRAPAPLALPVHTGGFLDASDGGHSRFSFRFNNGTARATELGDWDSSCYPHSTFVSRSEFVAFGCRGTEGRQTIAGFNLSGDFMWQQSFYEQHVNPSFVFAPAAGRFALGRTLIAQGTTPIGDLTPSQITAQEVRVYQTYNGRILLRTTCTPAMRAGQNFALSPDGLHLAVLRETPVTHKGAKEQNPYSTQEAAVEVYDLPALTKQDQTAVAEAHKAAPPDNGMSISAALRTLAPRKDTTSAPTVAASAPGVRTSPAIAVTAVPETTTALSVEANAQQPATEGDPQNVEGVPRKAPTLYAPDEKHPTPRSSH